MKIHRCLLSSVGAMVLMAQFTFHTFPAPAATIAVQVDKPGHAIAPTLWGIFFEDINCSADGGVYAELVRNRSLEDSDKPEHWSLVTTGAGRGNIAVSLEQPLGDDLLATRNRRSLRLQITEAGDGTVGVVNEGYWGIPVERGATYDLSLSARAAEGFSGPVTVTLQGTNGTVYATGSLKDLSSDWKTFKLTLLASGADPKARLVLSAAQKGTVWFDMVSLFPRNTWKNGPGGLRPDLMAMLEGIQPSFNRFPGGCWVEGDTMKEAYRWKDTVGDLAQRRTQRNIWDYWATHGVGFHEYLQMCEDLKTEPLFVINCGMSHKENIPADQMGPFVQDALDALEYCNGPVTSRYGALRAKNGHPAPFNLKFMEIGNENGGPVYYEHWPMFYQAIKAKYPGVTLIANQWFNNFPRNVVPEMVDEHYYDSPEFFMVHATHYDHYDRTGPKIYIGEYAVTRGAGSGNLRGAIGEAAFMTGVERNSDIVVMASYAPLFANLNYKKWNPDLINYDNTGAYGLPSYYVQQLFSLHRGNVVLPVQVNTPRYQYVAEGGGIGVGTWKTQAEFKDIKVTHGTETLFASDFSKDSRGWKPLGDGQWSVKDGAFRQDGPAENVRAVLTGKQWKDYTYSLKARKLGGDEGFLILFNTPDENAKSWWNIGGWGNQQHGVEIGGVSSTNVNGAVELNRWYDIRIEASATGIKCFLDNRLIHDLSYPELNSLYSSASRDEATGDIIVKVVNAAQDPVETDVHFTGARNLEPSARAWVLASANPTDENSLAQPQKVVPVSQSFPMKDGAIHHVFPGNSLTVVRVKAGK